jgi:type II secretory pathway pseudopilin PulG
MTSAERLKQYEEIFNRSQQYDPSRFQSDFEKAYGEATNYNKDLIEQRSGAIGQAQALPAQLRQQYSQSAIRNPLAQEALIATQRGNVTSDISRLTDLLGARGARYEDVLGKHLSAYQTDAQRAQRDAENAWRLYQDALAQEEAQRARAAAAAQQAALENMMRSQFAQPQMVEDDLVIDTGDDRNWSQKFERSQTTPLAQTGFGQALGINTPDWVTATPFGTFSNMIGNLIGNRNRPNTSFLDKLFDRR